MSFKPHFLFSSATCGFKKNKKLDLALIYSPTPCTYSGVFTTNKVHAPCIDENKNLLRKKIRAIVINSGNANACTGKKGLQAIKKTKQIAARLLKIKEDEILVASTGVIGIYLDMQKMKNGLLDAAQKLGCNYQKLKGAAEAILTTDRFEKIAIKKTKDFNLIGFTKGAGMIYPNMATMLCFLMTDLKISQILLQNALKQACDNTFNTISVDGDMSTNDMVILLTNNQSKKEVKSKKDLLFVTFQKTLNAVCHKLAKDIVSDGEGAKKLITVHVTGAKTNNDAKEIAKAVASSTLFKCAVFGADPNWGRIAARVGSTKVKVNQDKIDISLNNKQVYKNGNPLQFDKVKLSRQIKKKKEVKVIINLKSGNKSASALGCDLSYDYVKFNSMYFT